MSVERALRELQDHARLESYARGGRIWLTRPGASGIFEGEIGSLAVVGGRIHFRVVRTITDPSRRPRRCPYHREFALRGFGTLSILDHRPGHPEAYEGRSGTLPRRARLILWDGPNDLELTIVHPKDPEIFRRPFSA